MDIAINNPVVNDPPTVVDETITVEEGTQDTPINIPAPVDPEGDPLTIAVTELPKVGTVTKADGTPVQLGDELTLEELEGLLYNVPTDYDGSDPGNFSYDVSDGTNTVPGTVDITVIPNEPPIANEDIEFFTYR
ncbi:MAG: hypothetical protein F6K35_36080 [Okeania sp. SIO2H7]|nr:hypothetical protein [Okeania sp. SIO2H7]